MSNKLHCENCIIQCFWSMNWDKRSVHGGPLLRFWIMFGFCGIVTSYLNLCYTQFTYHILRISGYE